MSLTHCPLCIALALLSVTRALAHMTLLGLQMTAHSRRGLPLLSA